MKLLFQSSQVWSTAAVLPAVAGGRSEERRHDSSAFSSGIMKECNLQMKLGALLLVREALHVILNHISFR